MKYDTLVANREQQIKYLEDNMASLTDDEINFLNNCFSYRGIIRRSRRLLRFSKSILHDEISNDDLLELYYCRTIFGEQWQKQLLKAKEYITEKPQLFKTIMLQLRYRGSYYTRKNIQMVIDKEQSITNRMIMLLFWCFDKEDWSLIKGYEENPKFQKGAIVQMRSNIGVDAILTDKSSGWGCWQSVGRRDLEKLKKKTFMVLSNDVCTDATTYSRIYTYSQTQGGSRLYKVLPIGEIKTYYIVEKFMKKCRTKAVKDAKK